MALRVLVTGADGFVGSWTVRRLLDDGHQVWGTAHPASTVRSNILTAQESDAVRWLPLELTDGDSVRRCAEGVPYDAVIHLAGVAWSQDAAKEPGRAWDVNAGGTARLVQVLAEAHRADRADPVVLVASSCDVYGRGEPVPRKETDPPAPTSPYAATKVGVEQAALEAWRRVGLRVIVARPFPHTGAGQDPRLFVPSLAASLLVAKQCRGPVVKVGNLEPVREFLHVRDVVDAYVRLLLDGEAGQVYNVARGEGIRLREVFDLLCDLVGHRAIPEPDPQKLRVGDLPHLVGDAQKLKGRTGWQPRFTLETTLRDVVDHAQAD
jgi:GDP-4-dehydro-6-deoxy-D-mannose reductase